MDWLCSIVPRPLLPPVVDDYAQYRWERPLCVVMACSDVMHQQKLTYRSTRLCSGTEGLYQI